jgi:putative nucleotidyltransferase with HDIG domain
MQKALERRNKEKQDDYVRVNQPNENGSKETPSVVFADPARLEPLESNLDSSSETLKQRFLHANIQHPAMAELVDLAKSRMVMDAFQIPENHNKREKINEISEDQFSEKPAISLKNIRLPALPQIFPKLQQAMSDPNVSVSDLAKIVSMDTSLSACLLRIVNSPFYGFASRIDKITTAVALIGTRQLSTLAMGALVLDLFKTPPKCLNMELFWKHSIACGIMARAIATHCEVENTERYFVAGLVHDIGRLALFSAESELAENIINFASAKRMLLYQAEKSLIGFDHAWLGAAILQQWQFPPALCRAVLFHHFPEKDQENIVSKIVHLSDIIIRALGIGSSGDFYVPPLSLKVLEDINLPVDNLSQLVEGLERKLEEAFEILIQR